MGLPIAQGRARIMLRKTHGGRIVPRGITPARTRSFASFVATMAQAAMRTRTVTKFPLDCPLAIEVISYFHKPRRPLFGDTLMCVKPDGSNLLKLVEDALEVAGVYRNDSRICDGTYRKRYADTERTVIRLWRLEEEVRDG